MSTLTTNVAAIGGGRARATRIAIVGLSITWFCSSAAAQQPPDTDGAAEATDGRPVQQSPTDALKAELEALQAAAEEAEKAQSRQSAPQEQPVSTYQQQRDFRAAQQEARLQKQRSAAEAAAKKSQALVNLDSAADAQALQRMALPQSVDVPETQESPPSSQVSRNSVTSPAPGGLPGALANIAISFQPDVLRAPNSKPPDQWTPRISGALNGGFTVVARAEGHDATGQVINIDPEWIPADPSTVTITPAKGQTVKITVRGAGASNLTVAASGISKDLLISAAPDQQNAMRVEILQ